MTMTTAATGALPGGAALSDVDLPDVDLDLPGDRAETRVVVAMSGGVDSSVAAAMVAKAGYQAIGITLQLYDHGAATGRVGACCAGQDIHDARRVATGLGIPHYVLDYESRFRHAVMEDFADTYLSGATPIPCVRCNQRVKFKDLLETARDLGAAALVTGHYVRRTVGADGAAELRRGADLAKDQSYFLFATTPAQLDYLRFPLGGWDKTETRRIATAMGLVVAEKADSQDICFVPNGRYADVVRKLRPEAEDPGDIVDMAGTVLGRHKGIVNFTIGQRRGLGLGGHDPLYVVKLDAAARQVIVGPKEALGVPGLIAQDVNWLVDPAMLDGRALKIKVRSTHDGLMGRAQALDGERARIVFDAPHPGISPGQAAVLYDGADPDRVLGGGWIAETLSTEDLAAAA